MTPDKLEKIRRLAEDVRGDPATRAIAQAALKRYAQPQPKPKFRDVPPRPETVPGVRPSADYNQYTYLNLGLWRKSTSGNPTRVIDHRGRTYRVVIFKHKKTPTWGWMRADVDTEDTVFSSRFTSMAEAHRDSWSSLMSL
jgi:hypothetical protein